MNDDNAFAFSIVPAMAKNLGLEVRVSKEGRLGLHHLHNPGEDGRPSDEKVETFRNFLSRNRDKLLRAHGCETVVAEASGIALDARRLKQRLDAWSTFDSVILTTPGGTVIDVEGTRSKLVANYREEMGWVLSAFRFLQSVKAAVEWRLVEAGTIPEAWAAEWGLQLTGAKSPACPPGSMGQKPIDKPKTERRIEESLFDDPQS